MAQAKADEYEGVVLADFMNLVLNWVPSVVEGIKAITPRIDVPATCSRMRIFVVSPNNTFCRYVFLNEEHVCIGQAQMQGTRNVVVPQGSKYFYLTFEIDDIDDVYVLDETNNVYLWKGKNV